MWPDGLNRPIHTAAVDDKEFKLTWLVVDTMQARDNTSCLIQRRNNHRNFHGPTKNESFKMIKKINLGKLMDVLGPTHPLTYSSSIC
jgi:hypothetical protein